MPHPLEEKIGQVRRRAWRLLAAYAVSWTLTTLLAAVIVLGLADYLIRFQDPGVRLIASLAVLGALAWACYRFLYRGLANLPLGDVQLAQRIERRFPSLTDQLASTIQFLRQPELDPQAGSAALRRAVIVQTESQVAQLDVNQVFESRPTRNALAVLGIVLLIAAVLVALSPTSALLAVTRLARPLGDDAWPRYYRVEFRNAPTRLAAGQNFEVELIRDEQHRVPEDVRIHFRYRTDESTYQEDVEPMRWVGGVLVARKENVLRPFEYRAEGGDDNSMPWIALEVLEPPQVAELRVVMHPPAYTGLSIEDAQRSIHALRGTRLELAGSSTKRIASASWRHEDGSQVPLMVAADGYSFSLAADTEQPVVVDKTGQYWIELSDEQGLHSGDAERWDIRAVPDLEPTVTIEQPATNSFVTPQGELAVSIAVKDDLAIHEVDLHFQRSDRSDAGEFALPLYQGEPTAPQWTESGLLLGGKLGESRVITHRWTLADLKLEPGSQVTFWATASDYLPQTGKSTPRKINIITPAELEERLAQRQTLVIGELQRVLKLQQDARSQTRSLEIQVDQLQRIAKNDVDHAQSAELNQRQVTRTLTSDTEGIPAQIAEFLSELQANHVDSPGVERNMAAILDEIRRLEAEHLKAIESDLTSFIKAAQSKLAETTSKDDGAAPDEATRKSLAGAGEHQDQVISSLESMLDELGRWDNYRRFSRDVAELERQQAEIAARTKELAPKTLGRPFKELDEQQQADLRKLASEQAELSRRLEKTQQQMGDMSRQLEEKDPIAAATISDGLHHARERAISNQMRDSSRQLEQNQLGQAEHQQQKISHDLAELQSILANRKEQELARLTKQLREAEDEIDALRKKQAGLRKKLKEAEQIVDPHERMRELQRLAREQKRLAEDAERLARKLARLQAAKAGRSTAGASSKMSSAGEKGEQGDAAEAAQQATAAERDLEEAQQQLAERRKQAEQDLANEQLARMEDSLKSLHDRQRKLIQETQRLEQARASAQRLSRAELATLSDLARQQLALGGETELLAEKLSATEVLHLALSGAARQMDRAAELLELRETGMQTQNIQESARTRLERLLAALENKKKPGDQKRSSGGGGSGGENGQCGVDGNLVLTQLKLLKVLQEDLNDRYRELMLGGEQEPRRLRRDLAEIAEEQGRLAELILKLAAPPAERPEDTPEQLPDVREPDGDAAMDDVVPNELDLPDLNKALHEEPGEASGEGTRSEPPPDSRLDPTEEPGK
jgi:hypothetical protein